ncbi:MAG: GrpB family protein [Candidatus Micrarchaeales archaeon]
MSKKIEEEHKYAFKKHSSIYKSLFKAEKGRLSNALKNKNVVIEHVGSTSVAGLGGRNILDIAIGVKKGRMSAMTHEIEGLGYKFSATGGAAKRIFFARSTKYHNRNVDIHLHLERFNGLAWKEHTAFRDYLIKHKDAMLRYAGVKKRAAAIAKGNKEVYRRMKGPFIKEITKKALKLKS